VGLSLGAYLLSNGVRIEDVATLLGNTVKIAQKHYAPWVQSRQIALEKSIEKAWSRAELEGRLSSARVVSFLSWVSAANFGSRILSAGIASTT